MTPLPKRTLEWMFKVRALLQFFNKSKFMGPKHFESEKFFLFLVKFKLGFSASLRCYFSVLFFFVASPSAVRVV